MFQFCTLFVSFPEQLDGFWRNLQEASTQGLLQNIVWTNPSTNAAALASNWLTHFRILCNHCMDSMKLNRKQVLKVFYQVCIFRADMSTNMAALAFDWLTHFQRISTKLYRKQVLKIIYLVCVFRADPSTNMVAWPLIGWDFSATAAWISSEFMGSKYSTASRLCSSGWSVNKDGCPDLWLADTFSLLCSCCMYFKKLYRKQVLMVLQVSDIGPLVTII